MSTFTWYPKATEFAAEYGVPPEVVEAAASQPTRVGLNEDSGTEGYVIEDRRRGDVTAVVGYRDPTPSILYVRVHTGHTPAKDNDTHGGGTAGPKTMRGVRARILAEGFRIVAGGSGHDKVLDADGAYLCTLPVTPSDKRSVPNAWASFRRARDKRLVEERIAAGNLLLEAW